ncbi:hypothetical protein M378DRAFT_163457 [Amanita muscaria Koide BX008]|uniref:Uncharacterized protein n=1 Tax=Amanita muscaria (strain Koide BX008) TaxID=946122 RepID=A0A0C2WRB8_AMAMK|nr:hypothetical protein M378DRAFT_163457 [Amanita muscaria Koide BX008]
MEVCMVYVAAAIEARWYGSRAGGGGVAALLTSLMDTVADGQLQAVVLWRMKR